MIIAEQKPISEIQKMIEGCQKVMVAGCGTCVTVCFAGGEKEVGILASALRIATKMNGGEVETVERTLHRQCEWEFVDELKGELDGIDAIVSLGCGVGVQALAERLPGVRVIPGLNTKFMGLPLEQGVWAERCAGCGDCVLGLTGGICPIARCSKSLLNGPCGGSANGKCEIAPDVDCGWQLIYDRLSSLGMLHLLEEINPPKDWSSSRDGGPRRIVREDLRISQR
ncbi:MAG: methylenetetrahydrofolate reductase C-terminal domain-containing protein [Chloroflexota bacterium]